MSALFVNVLRQAFKTFDRSNQATFNVNFQLLKQLTDQLSFRDMHLSSKDLLNDSVFEQPGRAPVTFVHIFENDIISMSIFVMRAGFTMPLHDHPMMYGLLRGIYGNLRIQSYTQQFSPNENLFYEHAPISIRVVAEEPVNVNTETECAILTPRERNFHEISALGGVAAFFDILSPPYDAETPEYGSRKCRFYRPTTLNLETEEPQLSLERIPAPFSYYCDTAEAPQSLTQSTFIHSAEAYSTT